ncbi:putative ubiquitin-conjugating enzyme E2 7 isoform X2 [Tubulanus polymorphus]|uniref:putative ubiquitin-conjugating enzyme E2 7 isoform X2 n=1 Tax=Tubulanus polymorphus TaxID=672921 RepID=UPI003DA4F79B
MITICLNGKFVSLAHQKLARGLFKAHLTFPQEYPYKPPKMTFVSKIWHPNVHSDGTVCISILHEPGEDKYGYERASERWLPVHTVESILLSVISMLSDPNTESPANIDAAKQFRENFRAFRKEVSKNVKDSLN